MGKNIPMEKASLESVSLAILKGIGAGVEDILPDVGSVEMGKAFFADPKALERRVGARGGRGCVSPGGRVANLARASKTVMPDQGLASSEARLVELRRHREPLHGLVRD